jgi:hypothetical protein
MLTIYATKKLRDDWPMTNTHGMPTTTVLGDWYADILYVEPEVVLFMNERTQLCVPVLADPFINLSTRFMQNLVPLLQDIGVPSEHIEAEMKEMLRGQITPAKNFSHLAALNDKMIRLQDHLFSKGNPTLEKVARRLATMPFKMIGWHTPSEMVMKLLAGKDDTRPAKIFT